MNFSTADLMTLEELTILVVSNFPNQKADAVSRHLQKYCFIQNSILYVLHSNITYTKTSSEIKNVLLKNITTFIEKSFLNLTESDRELFELKYKKEYPAIFTNSNVEKYYPQLICNLENSNIILDHYFNEIHYINGFLDLKTLEFKKRDTAKHFITKFINREYKPSSQEEQKKVLSHIKKTYADKQDLECILMTFGSALSGLSTQEQDILFLLGLGESGKSLILELTKSAVECYFKELQADTFSLSNSKIDKILNSFSADPQIRISWVNEMKDTKMDDSLFKSFCDGAIQTTKLYTDGQQTFQHYSKAIITANTMPNIKVDTGTARRFKGYTHQSKFTDDEKLVDEKKHIYLKDKKLKENIKAENLLDAWVDILAKYCNKWLNGEKIKYTGNFEETKDVVMNSNDIFKDFIDGNLIITNNPDDRIGKNKMGVAFKNVFPSKHLTILQIITSLKEKGIQYNSKFRSENIQGCFVGVKIKGDYEGCDEDDCSSVGSSAYYDDIINNKESEITKRDETIKQMAEEIEKLKELLLLQAISEGKKQQQAKKPKSKTKLSLVLEEEKIVEEPQGLGASDLDFILSNI